MNRLHYMDALRAILMMLGVVLHSANVFASNMTWLVTAEQTSPVFGWISEVIHYFRMPAFFVISGYFCALTLEKYGTQAVKTRLMRVVIPLVSVLFLINYPQFWLLHRGDYSHITSLAELPVPVYHLWFLCNIIIYYLAIFALYRPLSHFFSWLTAEFKKANIYLFIAVLLTVALIQFFAAALGFVIVDWYQLGLFFSSYYQIIVYFSYFFIGVVFFKAPVMFQSFMTKSLPLLAVLSCCAVWLMLFASDGSELTYQFTIIASKLMVIYLLLQSFQYLFSKLSQTWQYLSEASYSVYLFHHPIIVFTALYADNSVLPIWLNFLLLMAVAMLGSLLIHHFIVRRFSLFGLLFNGKKYN